MTYTIQLDFFIDDNEIMEEKELQEVVEAIFENVNCEALNINLIKINRS